MKLRDISLRSVDALEKWARDVRRVLSTEGDGGIRWADQIGPVIEYDHIPDNEPIRVRLGETRRPRAVFILDATVDTPTAVGLHLSNCSLQWRWEGSELVISNVDEFTSGSATYRVTLGILRS